MRQCNPLECKAYASGWCEYDFWQDKLYPHDPDQCPIEKQTKGGWPMEKRFLFDTPEQLKEIASFCADGSSAKVMNVARVWSAEKRKKEHTPWDSRIGAVFYTEGRKRNACVFRLGTGGERCTIGWLKYNAALHWCEQRLKRCDYDEKA